MMCFTPAAFAASAMFFACAFSFSAEKCSQKFVTAYTPSAPANAFFRLSTSSRSALTTSAPRAASAFALSPSVFRVTARHENPPLGSERIALQSPPPCDPVDPITAITFAMTYLPPISLRTMAAPSARALSFILATMRQRLHAAVGAQRNLLGRYVLENFANPLRHLFRLFDRVRADVEDANLQ